MRVDIYCEKNDRGYSYQYEVHKDDGTVMKSRKCHFYSDDIQLQDALLWMPSCGILMNILPHAGVADHAEIKFHGLTYRPTMVAEAILQEILCERYTGLRTAIRNLIDPTKPDVKILEPKHLIIDWGTNNITPPVQARNHATVSFSFGKESHLNRHLWRHVLTSHATEGYSLYYGEMTGYSRNTWVSMKKRYPDDHFIGSSNNYNQMRKFTTDLIRPGLSDKIWMTVEYLYPFTFIPIAYANRSRWYSMGNEIDTTRVSRSVWNNDLYFALTLFDESLYYEFLSTLMMNELMTGDCAFFSPVSCIYETKIVQIMATVAPHRFFHLRGCWSPGRSGREWCGKCVKCQRYHDLLDHLNLPMPYEIRHMNGFTTGKMLSPTDELTKPEKYNKLYTYRLEYMPSGIRDTLRDFYSQFTEPCDDHEYPMSGHKL